MEITANIQWVPLGITYSLLLNLFNITIFPFDICCNCAHFVAEGMELLKTKLLAEIYTATNIIAYTWI